MSDKLESKIDGYPDYISYDCTKEIMTQMRKNICKIIIGEEKVTGTGFFCKIPFPNRDKMMPVFITNNHVLNKNKLYENNAEIEIYIKEEKMMKKMINLNDRIKYTSSEYDTTIIEINEEKDNIKNFLELDDTIINDIIDNNNENNDYIDQQIYIIQYPKGRLSVSYGIIGKILENKKFELLYKCSTESGSSGSPILNINNNKIIGIHKKAFDKKFNKGTFLNFPIKEFILNNYNPNAPNKTIYYNMNNIYMNTPMFHHDIMRMKFLPENLNRDRKFIYNYSNMYNDKDYIKNICDNNNCILYDLINSKSDSYLRNLETLKNLESLNLSYHNLDDISILEKAKFNNLKVLDLSYNKISDISILKKFDLIELKILDLDNNDISNINVLKKVNFRKLEILNLSSNKIVDINNLKNADFKELKHLLLNKNYISNINVLAEVNFKKLEILNLNNNKISDINVITSCNFNELKELSLNGNEISFIKALTNANFKKLEILDLGSNNIMSYDVVEIEDFDFEDSYMMHKFEKFEISDISILTNVNFNNLKRLDLSKNKKLPLYIHFLKDVDFKGLKYLFLTGNNISDINILQRVNFKLLETLYLNDNNIVDINALEKVEFGQLKALNLNNNKISNIDVLSNCNFNELKYLYLGSNNISVINIFKDAKFKLLEILDLSKNKISDISILDKVNFEKLIQLILNNNKISNINVLANCKFDNLSELNLGANNISDINVLEIIKFKKLKMIDLTLNERIGDVRLRRRDFNFKVKFGGCMLFHIYSNIGLEK